MSRKVEDQCQGQREISEKVKLSGAMSAARHVSYKSKRLKNSENEGITIENYYDSLADDDSDYSENQTPSNWAPRYKRGRSSKNFKPAESGVKKVPLLKTHTPPPITIEKVSINILLTHMKSLNLDKGNVAYKNGRGFVKIFTKDTDTFNKVVDHCKKLSLAGYTHSLKEEKLVRYCLYGLSSMDGADIAKELKDEYNLEPVKIRQFYQNKDYADEVIYMVYFKKSQNVTIESLRQVTGIQGIRTKFRHFHTKEHQTTQCSNCQGFGHGSQNCFKKPICVRCAGDHSSKTCPLIADQMKVDNPTNRPQVPIEKLKCALCQKSGHSAAWRNCEVRIEQERAQQAIRRSRRNMNRRGPTVRFDLKEQFPPLKPNNTHPLQTAYHVYNPAPPKPSTSNWRPQTNNKLISVEECLEIYDTLVDQLLQCTNARQQLRVIQEFALRHTQKYLTTFQP